MMPWPPETVAAGGTFDTPTIASALTLLTVTIKSVLDHQKGKSGATNHKQQLNRIEKKLDDFVETQTTRNHEFDKRIDTVSAHVVGPDGENGLRSRVKALEDNQRGDDVGSYRPPRRA